MAAEAATTEATDVARVAAMVMKAAHAVGSEVEAEAIVEAAEMVVVQTMQVEGLAAAQEEIVSAVQAMGWGEAEAAIMEVVQTVIMEATEAVGQESDWLWEFQMAVEGAHRIVLKAAALEQSEAAAEEDEMAAEAAT